MIAASEPLEFVPRGRQAVEEHTGPVRFMEGDKVQLSIQELLLHRMQSVNIKAEEVESQQVESTEFWSVREIYEDCNKKQERPEQPIIEHTTEKTKPTSAKKGKKSKKTKNETPKPQGEPEIEDNYLCEYFINSEEELYVKQNTAVWTRGLSYGNDKLPRLCFTCQTPIKFALFCDPSFVWGKSNEESNEDEQDPDKRDLATICLIDQTVIRVYCSNGEDFMSHLEFPVTNVWPTRLGILLEKIASSTTIQNQTIQMPRLFSLAHPLEEACPILNKAATNVVSYFFTADYHIIHSSESTDLMFLYDSKIGKHFVAKLRKATEKEVHHVSAQSEPPSSAMAQQSLVRGMSTNSAKTAGENKKTQRPPNPAAGGSAHFVSQIGKILTGGTSLSGPWAHVTRTSLCSPLNQLHSSMRQNSVSLQDRCKVGQSLPSKPIVPKLCLEHIWSENMYGNDRELCEMATRAFFHTDLIDEQYLCYLLPRSCKLQIVSLTYNETAEGRQLQIATMGTTIPAKDAVCIKRMKMIAVLDPSGILMLYSGKVLVSKVHVPTTPVPGLISDSSASNSMLGTPTPLLLPKRSSLIPGETTFDGELHAWSPVHPPSTPITNNNAAPNVCLGLRDPAGNRITLIHPFGKMYRISLPLITESKFVTRCIKTLQQILKKDLYIQLIIRWYGARNPPGSRDYSIEQEWENFKHVLLDMMGCLSSTYDTGTNTSLSFNAEEPKKRRKDDVIDAGTNDDWNFMLSVLKGTEGVHKPHNIDVDTNACLFTAIPSIYYGFHLLYEDFKLDESMHDCLLPLAKFLHQLAIDMGLITFTFHYSLDFPQLLDNTTKVCLFTEQHGAQMPYKELLQVPALSVFSQLEYIIKNQNVPPYIYVEEINDLTRNVLQLTALALHGHSKMRNWIKVFEFPDSIQASRKKRSKRHISVNIPRSEQVLQMLITMDITRKDIERLPVAVHLIIAECLEFSRLSPPIGHVPATYELILRSELKEHAQMQRHPQRTHRKTQIDAEDSLSGRCPPTNGINQMETTLEDGMDNIDTKLLSLRFPDDMRIAEVRRLLTSSEPVPIDITQSPGTSDHEFIEEQEKQLLAMCVRTMTLPMGRGMFTLRTLTPTPTEQMPIPKLCLTGKEPIKGATVELHAIEFPANMNLWPMFHNGVAAGLKVSQYAREIDSNWIVYNKPKSQTETSTEHAGFLMALGLNGHLKTLSFMSIYNYLVRIDEMTSVGLLLGICATHRGSMDNTTTKLLCVHIEALLPATALELDIPQNTQVASIMGIGLLYQGTAKRHIAEVLLQEVGRPPGPEMENSVERESYALTAGLALGLVTLGQGESPAGLRDLQLPDMLHYYMVGGSKRPLTGSQKEKYKLPSFQVREGDNVNIDVTAPGATLALGFMFFNTGNEPVAEWMNPPSTRYLLDQVRPDLLMLRTIARGLILWSDIRPDEEWLFQQFPENLKFDIERGVPAHENEDVDHEAITQAYCNIIAGAAFCIGLKYAGTENPEAFKSLRKAIKLFLGFPGKYVGEFAGRWTIESSLMLILISIALVFAGSGDLEILRIIRYLRSRVGPQHSHVTYGSHMAIHMSLGLLFLGAGRYTISKTPEAVAALVCAFFPKFPNHSNDNRYHLQAFRHLYVLAVEPRLFLPRDIDTRKLCLCNISVLDIGSTQMRRLPMAPCMLPELSTLQKVVVDDPVYWPVCFEKGRNWQQLITALENSACVDIKKRSGCLSHLEDPDRLKSLFAQTLTMEQYTCWEIDPTTLERFTNEPYVIGFTDRFLHMDTENMSDEERRKRKYLTMLFYNAVVKDKMHVLPIYLALFDHTLRACSNPRFHDVWQLKLIELYLKQYKEEHLLISSELLQAQIERFKIINDTRILQLSPVLGKFLTNPNFDSNILAGLTEEDVYHLNAIIIYYNLMPNTLSGMNLTKPIGYFEVLLGLEKVNVEVDTAFGILQILKCLCLKEFAIKKST